MMENLEAMSEGEIYMPKADNMTTFATGVGVIEPTGNHTVESVEAAVADVQKPIEDPAVVCIDERRDIREPQPVREKVAGGNLNTFFVSASAIEWSGYTHAALDEGPSTLLEQAAGFLVGVDETLGAHRHASDASEMDHPKGDSKKTGCGAIDNGAAINYDAAEHAMDEEWTEQAKADLGEGFNIEHWIAAKDGYARLAASEKWQKWDYGEIQEAVEQKDGTIEVLDAKSDAFAENVDNADQRHGHFAEAIKVNHNPGYSNDRDKARIPFFQVDIDPMVRMANKAGATAEETSLLVHAEAMRQYATAYRLTKNMWVIR